MTNEVSLISRRKNLIIVVVFIVAVALSVLILSTEPAVQRESALKETAMLVSVETVNKGSYHPQVRVLGQVQAVNEVDLQAQVAGAVVQIMPAFHLGSLVKQGETLLLLDTMDYEIQLQQAKASLIQAQADLEIELGQQERVKKEVASHSRQLSADNKALVLRAPQLKYAQSRVESAKAGLKQAELSLSRTRVIAPFDGMIVEKSVSMGAIVSPGVKLAYLVGTERAWVEAAVPSRVLPWLSLGAEAAVFPPGVETQFDGPLISVVNVLDETTRMAKAVVEIKQDSENASLSLLKVGDYVRCELPTKVFNQVFRISSKFLRSGNTVWLAEQGALVIQGVNVIGQDDQFVYIDTGLKDGAQIITSNMSSVRNGAAVRIKSADSTSNTVLAEPNEGVQ